MTERVLIVGQGLAGTALGLELETAGIPFAIGSDGHARAASSVAAGLVNPISGQRFVKTWRVDELLPFAERWYRDAEARLGRKLWHPLKLERRFANATEAERAARKAASGEFGRWAELAADGRALEIRGAARVDLPALLAGAAERWREAGVLRDGAVGVEELREDAGGVSWRGEIFRAAVLCTGSGALGRNFFRKLPFEVAKGEILRVRGARVAAEHAISRGTWVIGESAEFSRVGATYEAGREDFEPTAEARERLLSDARELVGGDLEVVEQRVGVRLGVADRLPVIGWRAGERIGFFGALGSKGTLFAPWLARAWRGLLCGATNGPSDAMSITRFF
jgi:ribosomal protein S19E (S16A)